ncbi:HAD family hydrolase [Compostibacter hankyongensis]|uniref:D,D-heptose 1,7-bisphosphate phosphatase n=1 Tax=Compostibacter hankyongensis TaxID=1007089 RepID=A0ABP8FW86_9BACT
MNKAIFIDKDGTLIEDVPYNVNPGRIRLEDHAAEGLRMLQEEGFLLIVASNQPGVALGYFGEHHLLQVNEKIRSLLLPCGVYISGFYYCPHTPEGRIKKYACRCGCRKPAPGLLLAAADALDIDTSRSWMIGDILHDVEAGKRAGCHAVLIDNGHETVWDTTGPYRRPDARAGDIRAAAELILRRQAHHKQTAVAQ